MLSMYMLPKVKNERKKIYNIVLKKKTKLHFVIENKIFSGTGSETEFENYFNYLNFIKDSNFLFKLLKKKNKLMKILVTGSGTLLGKTIIERLSNKYNIIGLYNKSKLKKNKIKYIKVDLEKKKIQYKSIF